MGDKQDQRSGDDSLNLQAGGNINIGNSLAEVREIAQLTFDANIVKLQGIAEAIVRARADELRNEFINRLGAERPQDVTKAVDPDFQFALFDAQKAYARTGDVNLSTVLVDMLVDRVGRDERSLIHVVLGESLTVAPRLTTQQFDVLTVMFVLKNTKSAAVFDQRTLQQWLAQTVLPFLGPWPVSDVSYEHLEYASCGNISVLESTFAEMLRQKYPAVFPGPQDDPAVEELARVIHPQLERLVNTWATSPARSFTLTSVGKAIGHANLKRMTGDPSDLAIWIH